jgi:hypothetical protein
MDVSDFIRKKKQKLGQNIKLRNKIALLLKILL